jgi:hypothetical protein
VCVPPQLVEMARRLFLIGVMVLILRGSVTQLVIATVMCAVYLLLQTEASPFEDIGGATLRLDLPTPVSEVLNACAKRRWDRVASSQTTSSRALAALHLSASSCAASCSSLPR